MTDNEMALILNDIVVIVDTREKKNRHILAFFDRNNIKYKSQVLSSCDYSFILPNYPELHLDYSVLIEKKNSLDEICGNFSKDRDRFCREFERTNGEAIHLIIEGATWKKIENASWRSKFQSSSMWGNLLTFSIRYKFKVWFVGIDESPKLLYNLIRYEILEKLKHGGETYGK